MKNGIKKDIQKNITRRKAQFLMFILLGAIGVGLTTLVFTGLLPNGSILALIPLIAMMVQHVQMWDLYNDIIILQKYITDKEFKEEFKSNNK